MLSLYYKRNIEDIKILTRDSKSSSRVIFEWIEEQLAAWHIFVVILLAIPKIFFVCNDTSVFVTLILIILEVTF